MLRLCDAPELRAAFRHCRDGTWNLFLGLEDSWRPAPHVTLQFGLRYEPMSRPVEVNHIDTVPFPCDCNNFAPRASVAYRLPRDRGVLRTAYGVQFGEIFETTYGQVRLAPPSSFRVIVPAPDLRDPLGGLMLTTIPPGFRSSTFVVDSNLRTPYSHQYNFTWEHGLMRPAEKRAFLHFPPGGRKRAFSRPKTAWFSKIGRALHLVESSARCGLTFLSRKSASCFRRNRFSAAKVLQAEIEVLGGFEKLAFKVRANRRDRTWEFRS